MPGIRHVDVSQRIDRGLHRSKPRHLNEGLGTNTANLVDLLQEPRIRLRGNIERMAANSDDRHPAVHDGRPSSIRRKKPIVLSNEIACYRKARRECAENGNARPYDKKGAINGL